MQSSTKRRSPLRRALEAAAAPCWQRRPAIEFPAPRLPRRATEDSMLTQPATRILLATLLLALVLRAGTRADEPNPQVKVTTNLGEFVIEVRQDRAPLTAANFLRYAREGFYSGTLIHRVVANFVIQGGGHDATSYALKPIVIEKMEILAPGATAAAPLVTPVTPPRQDTILSPK